MILVGTQKKNKKHYIQRKQYRGKKVPKLVTTTPEKQLVSVFFLFSSRPCLVDIHIKSKQYVL